jgi:hypothetical protein
MSFATPASRYDTLLDETAERQPLAPDVVVTDDDLAHLPQPVARFLRAAGVVGRPRVHNYVVEMDATLNRGPGEPPMETPVLQTSFLDDPVRLFLLRTRMKGIPVSGLHSYTSDGARMQIRLFGMWSIVDESGPAFTRAETVTLLNDCCVFAPATLIDPRFTWTPIDEHSAAVTFTNGAHRVSATLFMNDAGDLVDFSSQDRHVLPTDGERWSTPLRGHRDFGVARLPSEGDAIWHYADKPSWCYGTFHIRVVRYNVPRAELPHAAQMDTRD